MNFAMELWRKLWDSFTPEQKAIATDGGAAAPAPVVAAPAEGAAYSDEDFAKWQADNQPGTLPEYGCQCEACLRVWKATAA